jgi:hypothetical protein
LAGTATGVSIDSLNSDRVLIWLICTSLVLSHRS